MSQFPDLTMAPPRSAKLRINGYAILGRTLDKARASLNGTLGEYHYGCPLDLMLFGFKEITPEHFLDRVKQGGSDEEIAEWLDSQGSRPTPEEVSAWGDKMDATDFRDNPEKRAWFESECARLHLDPETATLFDYLEADDAASF